MGMKSSLNQEQLSHFVKDYMAHYYLQKNTNLVLQTKSEIIQALFYRCTVQAEEYIWILKGNT